MGDIIEKLKALASTDIFKSGKDPNTFVGRPFYFDYETVKVLVNDKWKHRVGGIPAGAFLLCSYDGEVGVEEMVLVRVVGPTSLPTDSDVVASMVDHYKEDQPPGQGATKKLDSYTPVCRAGGKTRTTSTRRCFCSGRQAQRYGSRRCRTPSSRSPTLTGGIVLSTI